MSQYAMLKIKSELSNYLWGNNKVNSEDLSTFSIFGGGGLIKTIIPLALVGYEPLISFYSYTAEWFMKITRIKEMVAKKLWLAKNSPGQYQRKCIAKSTQKRPAEDASS